MQATLPELDVKSLAQACKSEGYCIVRGLLAADEVDIIRRAFMEQGANGPVEGLSEMPAKRSSASKDPLHFYPRMMHPHQHPELPVGPLAMRYMLDHRIYQILLALFDGEPLACQSMFYFKPPGARGQDLHQDNFYLRVKPGTCMAAWMAIDDADQENGGMVVVPTTHNLDIACPEKANNSEMFFTSDHVEPPSGSRIVPADLKAGDVMFFNGSLIHGSYPNKSRDRFRRAFICHYVPAGAREMSNWYHPMRFDGNKVELPNAAGGGPCGSAQPMATAPH